MEKMVENTFWESESNFVAVFDSVRAAIVIIDPMSHKIVEANRLAAEISGYSKKELIGKKCFQVMCPAEEGKCPITDLGQRVDNSERLLITADGREIQILKTAAMIDMNGKEYLIESFVNITDLKEAELKILASLIEKEVLLRELRHRVKNNLLAVTSILQIQENFAHDDYSRKILRETQNRIFSMAIIHERLSQGENLVDVDFSEYVATLADQLMNSFLIDPDDVVINLDIRDVRLNIDTAIPCGLIVTELVANALNHAFPGGRRGEIRINLQKLQNENYMLAVRDNGVGLPDNVDINKVNSMGLLIVKGLVEQLSGTLKMDREGGTTFLIIFKEYTECGTGLHYGTPLDNQNAQLSRR